MALSFENKIRPVSTSTPSFMAKARPVTVQTKVSEAPKAPTLGNKLGMRFGSAKDAVIKDSGLRVPLRVAGAVAGGVNDTIGAIVSPFVQKAVDVVSDVPAIQKFATQRPVEKGLGSIQKGMQFASDKFSEFEEKNPEVAQDVKDLGNITSMIPITKGVSVTKNSVAKTSKPFVENATKKAVDSLENKYSEIASGTTAGKKKLDKVTLKTESLNKGGTSGKTPMRTLAESGVIPKRSGTKLDTFEQAKSYREEITPLREANVKALKEVGLSTSPIPLEVLEKRAIEYARTPENINSGKFNSMERDIKNEFALLRQHYPEGSLPLDIVDNIKSARWENVFKNKSIIEADVLKKDSEYAIAKSLQKTIEDTASQAGHTDIAQLNREIGDRLEAAKFLEELNGKTVKGGRVLKYVTTLIGASLGNTLPGKLLGAVGGNIVGELILANSVANPVKRLLLSKLAEKDPASYTRTINWLSKQKLDRETRLLLPAPKSGSPIILPDPRQRNPDGSLKVNQIQVTNAKKNQVSVDPKTGRFQRTYSSSD